MTALRSALAMLAAADVVTAMESAEERVVKTIISKR